MDISLNKSFPVSRKSLSCWELDETNVGDNEQKVCIFHVFKFLGARLHISIWWKSIYIYINTIKRLIYIIISDGKLKPSEFRASKVHLQQVVARLLQSVWFWENFCVDQPKSLLTVIYLDFSEYFI